MPTLTPGQRLGPYEVVSVLGAGGMGEVYRARDTRLGREVAIKVSAERFSERFEREARAVAALNHPNICTLHDVGPNYLVMELIEGESPKGPLPMETALNYARQIADALEAAHEKGIVHRDLKPDNIKITPDGVVKVLDFGLAKVAPASAGESQAEARATLTMDETQAGMILGTAGYMAPEQARGKPVDKRADIWAFGVVLYEMLTGQRLFEGETMSDTLAQVLTKEPDLDRVPAKARRLLQRCLQKDPKLRLRDIGDAWRELEDAPPIAPAQRTWIWPGGAAVCLLVALAVSFVHLREQPPPASEPVRFQIVPPEKLPPGGAFSVSPDGRKVVFVAAGSDNVSRLWVRALDSLEARLLPGTEVSTNVPPPFWSPDSRFVAFDAGGKLKKIDISGGPAQTVCDVPALVVGGSWNREGVIIFGPNGSALMRVPAAGGVASPLTRLDVSRQENTHVFPFFLPDGRHFVYLRFSVTGGVENSGVYVGSLDAKPEEQSSKLLVATIFGPAYVPSSGSGAGQLLFRREGTLMAQDFDGRKLELSGEPVPVAERLGSYLANGFFSASANGVLVYRTGGVSQNSQATWFDRLGKPLGNAGDPGAYANLALSPDGARAAAVRLDFQLLTQDLWLLDLAPGTSTRLTFGPRFANSPVWSADGSRIIFSSNRDGPYNLYQKPANGAKDEEVLLKSIDSKTPTSWSRDGRLLLYTVTDPKTKNDVWVLPLEGDRKARPFLRTEFNEDQGQFSPDSRWVAYQSNESGPGEVYVRDFAPNSSGGKWLVSKGGGSNPRWRRDGRELFYASPDGTLIAVDVVSGAVFQTGASRPLFKLPPGVIDWDVTADGKRFLVTVPIEQNTQTPFTVVLNWQAALKK